MKKIILGVLVLFLASCTSSKNESKDFTKYVDVFIGTRTPGHTYPGATLPFGMVQLSPDTRQSFVDWEACAGYDYDDTSIIGFSHTHLTGTGIPDLADILFQPITKEVALIPGDIKNPDTGYRSRFDHATESAEPGYYSVVLEDYKVKAEMTATQRTGVHRYSFPKSEQTSILIDVSFRDPVMESSFEVISDTEIAGFRKSKAWAGNQYQYFVARFSKPIVSYAIENDGKKSTTDKKFEGEKIVAVLNFDASEGQVISEVALSAVSVENARKNLDAESTGFNFEKVKADAKTVWNTALGKVEVEDKNEDKKTIFYTALYHSLLAPNLYSDVDGAYRGMDYKIHKAEGFNNYHVFSLWDTFRALHPLLTIVEPKVTEDIVKALTHKYEQFGELPMWELASNDTRCMIGYHGASVIADAVIKGIDNVDLEKALEAMVASAKVEKRGIDAYYKLGYVPTNKSSQSVSKTLEYAYDDWCIAQVAKKVGNEKVYEEFSKRARFFRNVYKKEAKFMWPRYSDGRWVEKEIFDPKAIAYNFNFTEGTSYQYSLFVPHDIQTVINSVGGDVEFNKWLDDLFTAHIELEDEKSDVSGTIGQYAHGNEPSHHMAYLYNFSGQPWKSQYRINQIMNTLYSSKPEGLCGNEDCGQMSAWYVLSAMGFYSVTPGGTEYIIGTPAFEKVTIHNDNGNDFVITAKNLSKENYYVASLTKDGVAYEKTFINHEDITKGGALEFTMSSEPVTTWAVSKEARPSSDTYHVVSIPTLNSDFKTFVGTKEIEFVSDTEGAVLYYTTDGSEPTEASAKYTKPFEISKTTEFKVKGFKEGLLSSYTATILVEKSHPAKMNRKAIKQGLSYEFYEGIFRSVHDWNEDEPKSTGIVSNFDISVRGREEWFGMEFNGYINIPVDGTYTFQITANDGCQLRIDGKEQFESDGRKGDAFTQSNDIVMSKGLHKIGVSYYQCSDKINLNVLWKRPNGKLEKIPNTLLFTQ